MLVCVFYFIVQNQDFHSWYHPFTNIYIYNWSDRFVASLLLGCSTLRLFALSSLWFGGFVNMPLFGWQTSSPSLFEVRDQGGLVLQSGMRQVLQALISQPGPSLRDTHTPFDPTARTHNGWAQIVALPFSPPFLPPCGKT